MKQQFIISHFHHQIAKTNGEEGKVKFFSPEINKALLDVELGLQKYSTGRERTSVIQLLTAVVPCSKETLVKRMKRLVTSQQVSLHLPRALFSLMRTRYVTCECTHRCFSYHSK